MSNVYSFIRRMGFWMKGLTALVALCALGVLAGVPAGVILGKILIYYYDRTLQAIQSLTFK